MPFSMSKDFPPAMVDACKAADAANVFYQDAYCAFVIQHMGGYGCEAVFLEEIDVSGLDFAERREAMNALQGRVVGAPRGSYALIRQCYDDRPPSWSMMVSDGTGNLAVGGKYDFYDTTPSAQKVLEKMVAYEIYLCRNALDAEQKHAQRLAAIGDYRLCVGMQVNDYVHPGEAKKFSKAVVTAVDEEFGYVSLRLTRRGTKNTWNTKVGADAFAHAAGLAK